MNDADSMTSPDDTYETVGNFFKFAAFSTLILASLALEPLATHAQGVESEELPVFFFSPEGRQIIGISPLSPEIAAVCSTESATSTGVENNTETLPDPECGLLVLEYSTSTQVVESGEGVVSSGSVVQAMDYYPYGSTRIDSTPGTDLKKQYIGQYFDDESSLSYLNARYLNSERGQFISQDPVFWEVGQTQDGKIVLLDPQQQNSYSYSKNNPIINKDADGRTIGVAIEVLLMLLVPDVAYAPAIGEENAAGQESFLTGSSLAISLLTARPGPDDAARLVNSFRSFQHVQKVARQTNWGNPVTLMKHTIDHAADFGLKSNDYKGYAKTASDFYKNSGNAGYQRIVGSDGTTRIYDSKTNTFGSYGRDGSTKTFFKPDNGKKYWNDQVNNAKKNVKVNTKKLGNL